MGRQESTYPRQGYHIAQKAALLKKQKKHGQVCSPPDARYHLLHRIHDGCTPETIRWIQSISNAGGFGNGGASNGNAIGTGVGNANAGPTGFGVGLGVGGAVATPLGNLAFGQGNGVAVNPGFGQFGNQGNLNGATGG